MNPETTEKTNDPNVRSADTFHVILNFLRKTAVRLLMLLLPAADEFFSIPLPSKARDKAMRAKALEGIKSLFQKVKSYFTSQINNTKAFFRHLIGCIKKRPEDKKAIIAALRRYGVLYVFSLLFSLFVWLLTLIGSHVKSSSSIVYGYFSLIALLSVLAVHFFAHRAAIRSKAAALIAGLSSVLICIGFMLQAMYITLEKCTLVKGEWIDSGNAVKSMMTKSFLGLVLGGFLLLCVVLCLKIKRRHLFVFCGIVFMCGLFGLLWKSPSVNGAHLSLSLPVIGSFQATEILKLLSIILFAAVFSMKDLSERRRCLIGFIVLGIDAVGYVILCNEIGTFVIILLIYFLMLFISLRTSYALKTAGLLLLLAVCLTVMSSHAYEKLHPTVTAEGITDSQLFGTWKTEEEREDLVEQARLLKEEEVWGEKWAKAGTMQKILSRIWSEKIEGRVLSFASEIPIVKDMKFVEDLKEKEAKSNPTGADTQVDMLRKAIVRSKAFGTKESSVLSSVPELSRELIFVFAMMEMGTGLSMFLVLAYGLIMLFLIYESVSLPKRYLLINVGIAVAICFQSLIEILVSLNLLPLVGIGAAFLSEGTAALTVNFCMLGLAFWTLGKKESPEEVPVNG